MDEGTPAVYFSWNPKNESSFELRVIDNTSKLNSTKYISDEDQFTIQKSVSQSEVIKIRSERSLETKNIYAFVNLAKEWKRKSCSEPVLEVYLNEDLLFTNSTNMNDFGKEEPPKEKIEIYIKANSSYFTDHQFKIEKKYIFVSEPATFFTARQDCSERGTRLLTIKSEDESKDVVEAMEKEQHEIYWTSGNKIANHKTWRWSDSEKFSYLHWFTGEPNNDQGNEFCMEIWKTGYWNDNICETKLPYICESVVIPKDNFPTVEVFVDKELIFKNYSINVAQTPSISVHIGMDGNNKSDHSTIVLFQTKYFSKDVTDVSENLAIPSNFQPENFNGIDFVIMKTTEKGFSCPKTYLFQIKPEFNYNGAMEFCNERSMQLLSIQDEKEQMKIEEEMLKRNIDHFYWTSGYLADGIWYWNEKEEMSYQNWAKGQPDNKNGNESCLEIYIPWNKARWNDQDCIDKNPVICESLD
nr:macrophage mannose receptor 1-like [Leptinotarsa decemlineata]